MSATHLARPLPEGFAEAVSKATRGIKKTVTPALEAAWRAKIGHEVSAETRAKIAAVHLGRPKKPESIEKTRLAHLGKKRSPEMCEKVRLSHTKTIQASDGRLFIGITAAATALGCSRSQIWLILKGLATRNDGLTLSYLD
jgi:hypothetical protein